MTRKDDRDLLKRAIQSTLVPFELGDKDKHGREYSVMEYTDIKKALIDRIKLWLPYTTTDYDQFVPKQWLGIQPILRDNRIRFISQFSGKRTVYTHYKLRLLTE